MQHNRPSYCIGTGPRLRAALNGALMCPFRCAVLRAIVTQSRLQPIRSLEQPNWDDEMTVFRKRTNTPNQLETLRKIEAEVEVGKVPFPKNPLANVGTPTAP